MTAKVDILLIDDDPEICWGIGRILTRKGFSVTSCGNGVDALKFLKERTFTFMITDINMPQMNGLTLLEWIRNNRPHTQVIVITGHGAPAIKRLTMGKGAILYLEKPVDPKVLVDLLNENLKEQKKNTFSGHTGSIDLLDYINFMLVTRKQAILEVESHNNESGVIYFDRGNIPHVFVDELVGQDAFYYLISNFDGGRFNTCHWETPGKVTINVPGEYLLLEAARLKDESATDNTASNTGSKPHNADLGLDELNLGDFDLQFPE